LREDFLLGFAVRTARAYKADLEDFREWCLAEDVSPLSPSAQALDGYCESVRVRGYARSTIGRRVSTVRRFLAYTVGHRRSPDT
jgi:site-specific recombinase XerD